MKFTIGQRLKILFTGKLPETPTAPTAPIVDNTIIASQRTKRSLDNYAALAKKCRKTPNMWIQIATVPRTTAAPPRIKNPPRRTRSIPQATRRAL